MFLLQIAYCQSPDTKAFSTKGHPKAKGINISIEYPDILEKREVISPHVVQKFTKFPGDGTEISCLISIGDFFVPDDKIEKILSKDVIKSTFGPNAKLLEYSRTKYDGQPGVLSSSTLTRIKNEWRYFSHILQHTFVYRNKVINIQCTVIGLESYSAKITEHYENYLPLFIEMGNSIIIEDK